MSHALNPVSIPQTPLRIVMVEDSKLIQSRLIEALEESGKGRVVGVAETETDAVALLGRENWDILILDLQLKVGTGLGVLKVLAAHLRRSNTTIVVFTNYAFPQFERRCIELGADYFLDKSRDVDRLRSLLYGPPSLH